MTKPGNGHSLWERRQEMAQALAAPVASAPMDGRGAAERAVEGHVVKRLGGRENISADPNGVRRRVRALVMGGLGG